MEKKLLNIYTIVFGALILLWPALVNRFPLIAPDSFDYIYNAFQGKVGFQSPFITVLL